MSILEEEGSLEDFLGEGEVELDISENDDLEDKQDVDFNPNAVYNFEPYSTGNY